MLRRREYLGAVTGAVVATAGCLGGGETANETNTNNTYLEPPENKNDPSAVSFPVYGEQLPEVTLTDALSGEEVTTTELGTNVMMTFVYGNCRTVCPRLTSTLKNIQSDSVTNDYADEVSFVEVTFDPERDTPEAIRDHVDRYNVNTDVGNWYVLRPESPERAKEVVQETYGVFFEKTHPENMDMYMYNHLGLILLANKNAHVERPYPNSRPVWQDMRDDLTALRNAQS